MNYKLHLIKSIQQNFVDRLADRDIQISPDLAKFLIPALLTCLEEAVTKSLQEMGKFIVEEDKQPKTLVSSATADTKGLFDDKSKY
jgi:hypothetical protein